MRRLPALALALLLAGPALAQDVPATGSSLVSAPPAVDETHATQRPALGDAIAGGLGAGLARVADPARYEVSVRFSNEELGRPGPKVDDWVGDGAEGPQEQPLRRHRGDARRQ